MSNKKIHFPILSSRKYSPSIINVARARGIIKKYEFDVDISYNMTRLWDYDVDINIFRMGLTVSELQDLDHMIVLLNNFKTNKPLLEGIPIQKGLVPTIESLMKLYDKELDYNCVVLTVFKNFVFISLFLALLIKKNNPSIDIMMGGPQIVLSEYTRLLFRRTKIFEYILEGDIEGPLKLYCLNNLERFREYNRFDWDIQNDYIMPIYYPAELHLYKDALLETSRGCNNICSYCVGNYEKFRKMSPETIIKVFKYYNQYSDIPFKISLCDTGYNYSWNKAKIVNQELIKIKNKVPIFSNFIFKFMDPDIIKSTYAAGFRSLFMGIDNFDNDYLDKFMRVLNKKNKAYIDIIDEILKYNFQELTVSMLYNVPGETRNMFLHNFERFKYHRGRYSRDKRFFSHYFPYSHGSYSDTYLNREKYGITWEYWNEIECYDESLNDIITKIPKNFYYNIDRDEYIYRYKLVSDFAPNCKYIIFTRDLETPM